jgi:hypothetical protein
VRYLFNPLSMPYGGAKRAAAAVPRARQTNPQLAQLQAEDLLDMLQRAGLAVWWLDNQSGCKRLCERVPQVLTGTLEEPVLCSGGERLDETMLKDPDRRIEALGATRLARGLVMHQMGSHGPAYFRRPPPAFKRTTANRWGKTIFTCTACPMPWRQVSRPTCPWSPGCRRRCRRAWCCGPEACGRRPTRH